MTDAQRQRKEELIARLRARRPAERFPLAVDPIDGAPIEPPAAARRAA